MIQTETCAVMNGAKNGNSSNSSPGFGSGNSGGGSEIKYPANCSARYGSSMPGFGISGESTDDPDKLYSPKRNKKIVRIVTVMGYIFAVSTVAILLSLYYLFLWDPYIKSLKNSSNLQNTMTAGPASLMIATNESHPLSAADLSPAEPTFIADLEELSISDGSVTTSHEPSVGKMTTTINPFLAQNKAQKGTNGGNSSKNKSHSPVCKQCSAA